MHKTNLLILDDEKGFRDELQEFFGSSKYRTYPAAKPSDAFRILEKHNLDIAIVDIRLPEMDGLDVLKEIKKSYPDIEVIMITGHGDMDSVITAMRNGALDFFNKPFSLHDVQRTIEKAKNHVKLNKNLQVSNNGFSLISAELENLIGFPIISQNALMKTVLNLMNHVAKSDHTTVLITGESGTGKELIARGIHYLSRRKNNHFHSVNCSAVPDELFESEFFGYNKGAFTGAATSKKGWFEAAHLGTLFLDEIADLKPNLQPKLLRVLDNKRISRLGATSKNDVDVRIVAATNHNLQQLVEDEKFRTDLYYRLNSFVIHLPPLRERKDDLTLLTDHFIKEFSGKLGKDVKRVHKSAVEHLMQYDFPGNVRELKNMIEYAVILCDGDELTLNHFINLKTNSEYLAKKRSLDSAKYDLEQLERNTIALALQKCDYNKSKTAKLLNISRQALDRKLKKWDIEIRKTI